MLWRSLITRCGALLYARDCRARMECEKENFYLFLSTMFTGFLWILSEIIGSSKCKAGGVFEFFVRGYCVEISRDTRNDRPQDGTIVTILEETPLLMDVETVE